MKRFVSLALGLVVALLVASAGAGVPTAAAQGGVIGPALNPPFYVRNYGGKCLDFGPPPQVSGGAVFIFDCNGTAAQRVTPVEVDPRPTSKHAVLLFAGNNKVIGVKANALVQQAPLELQDYNGSAGQVFELDGDSIILAADRQLVVEVQHGRGVNRTPLVLGNRDLADNEFWTFTATDGSGRRPTRGFVRISQNTGDPDNGGELRARQAFLEALKNARWGTVIELDANVAINLTDVGALSIPAGVTIRGDRRGTNLGPELRASHASNVFLFDIAGTDARMTGIRLRGPSRSLDRAGRVDRGILAHSQYRTLIDHNDLSDWPIAAVEVTGDNIRDHRDPRPENVRVVRNFIHHNRGNGFGYGVVIGDSGYVSIEGNTFVENRHAIAGDGSETSGYRAWFNLVLHAGPDYGHGIQQDFDMHGTGNDPCQHCGGIAGNYIEVARNTFLGGDRENFYVRGTPTYLAEFHHNITVGDRGTVLKYLGDAGHFSVYDNQFEAPNPTRRLGVGDFDGDGVQDLFLATGTAWYYAPGGKAEWRFLNAQTDKLDTLLFGDFDGDGRTDVFTQHGFNWDVSWGGASAWEKINVFSQRLGDYTVGNFVGDSRADVFYADGQHWYVSDGGTAPFALVNDSSYRIPDLRFGDFNADGKTDVFAVANGQWSVSYAGATSWQRLRSKLTDSAENLLVADFNGDGRADIATAEVVVPASWRYKVSYSGTGGWTPLRTFSLGQMAPSIGRFDGNASADVLLWHDDYLDISTAGTGAPTRHSRQDMR